MYFICKVSIWGIQKVEGNLFSELNQPICTNNNLHIPISREGKQPPLLEKGKTEDDRSDKEKELEKNMGGQKQGDKHLKGIMERKRE
jgi:hypothetical protein